MENMITWFKRDTLAGLWVIVKRPEVVAVLYVQEQFCNELGLFLVGKVSFM